MSQRISARRGERGSAYIVVLLALVVLTIIGLSLVMVSQTEVQLGANERTISRTFFAADDGVSIAPARHQVETREDPFTYIQNVSSLGNQRIADMVTLTKFTLLSASQGNGCTQNANDKTCYDSNYMVSSTATRVGWSGTTMPPVGAKVFSQSQVISEIRLPTDQGETVDNIRH
jgi:Tfp pilus assembly protein PilX